MATHDTALGDRQDICPQLRPDSIQIRPLNQPPLKSHASACAAAAHAHAAAARLNSSLTSMTLCLPPPPSCNTHVCTGSHTGMQHKPLCNFSSRGSAAALMTHQQSFAPALLSASEMCATESFRHHVDRIEVLPFPRKAAQSDSSYSAFR